MTPRDRVLSSLEHEEPDRVPLDLGGMETTMTIPAYENLKRYLGLNTRTRILSEIFQLAEIDEPVLRKFDIDTRYVFPGEPGGGGPVGLSGNAYRDIWGIEWRKTGYHYFIAKNPLSDADLSDLQDYTWPDPCDPSITEGMEEKARYLHDGTDYAVVTELDGAIFEESWRLRGLSRFLVDMHNNREFAIALLDGMTDFYMKLADNILSAVGDYVDIVQMGDDIAMQTDLLIPPKLYRELIKPRQKRYLDFIKTKTDAKIFYHCCGSIAPIIKDLIEVGVDILNPVQVSARNMDTKMLKSEFGEEVCFWGAIDTQKVLPFGSTGDVEEEVRKRIRDLAPNGGYVVSPVHTVQPEVPPQNVCAVYEFARRLGRYP